MAGEDKKWMSLALEEARKAQEIGEVPVGAVIIKEEKLISSAHNFKETKQDPTGHAEILAIKKASESLGTWRLEGCSIYVSLEPCLMCSGAIIQSRISKVVFGAFDPKGGAVCSCIKSFEIAGINHRPIVSAGVLKEESEKLLKEFFISLRK